MTEKSDEPNISRALLFQVFQVHVSVRATGHLVKLVVDAVVHGFG